MKQIRRFLLIALFSLPFFSSSEAAEPGDTLWGKSVTSGDSLSYFSSVVRDNGLDGYVYGNHIYAAGYIQGTGLFNFGNMVTVQGACTGDNIVLVKYDLSGNAQWAKSVINAGGNSKFYFVTTDRNGNIYAVGSIDGTAEYDFGNGVTVTGTGGTSVLIVKYDNSANAQVAKSSTANPVSSEFSSVSVDRNGNIYAVGSIYETGTYGFGNDVTATGTSSRNNILIVKYDSNGNAQWARSVMSGLDESVLSSVVVDNSENIYVAGTIVGTDTYNFGNGVTVKGSYSSAQNVLLVKYDSKGDAQWAKSVTSSTYISMFFSVVLDDIGNIYVGGIIFGTSPFDFGNSVTVSGTNSNQNVLLVKYDSKGDAQWAKSTTSGTSVSTFISVDIDENKSLFAAGTICGTGLYGFGNNVTASGVADANTVVVKYDNDGNAQWAKSVNNGTDKSHFSAVTVDGFGGINAAGYVVGNGTFDFGNNVTVNGSYSGFNALLVRYLGDISAANSLTPSKWYLMCGLGALILLAI